jgi:hypothetical protein
MGAQRQKAIAGRLRTHPLAHAQHLCLAGAIDVGIEDAHTVPFGGHGQCQVHCHGGLADATLAGSYGDDMLDPFNHNSLLNAVG